MRQEDLHLETCPINLDNEVRQNRHRTSPFLASRCFLHQDAHMRTTVDIGETLLRKARSKAALDGIRMTDVVNKALEFYLDDVCNKPSNGLKLPHGVKLETHGHFILPVIQATKSQAISISPKELKHSDAEEDLDRHAKVFGR